MQEQYLELVQENLSGFRLHRMELLNWGTFNGKIWKIEPTGFNSLLTGDIGSGKSTIVDAITTLLVPHYKIVYNKAAGADSKERTLLSYVRGEYKNEKNLDSGMSKAVYLRKENSYTVLLANFTNKNFEFSITLAQVFTTHNSQVDKFFIVSKEDLSIQEHFTNFGNEISFLKRRLKKLETTEVLESFKEYSSKFRSIFGIKSEAALNLFYQTVSMKSVGNLTDFVRGHMLEKLDVKDKIEELKKNYENLTQNHELVKKAKNQLAQLAPLVKDADEYEKVKEEILELQFCLDNNSAFFSLKKIGLLKEELEKLENEKSILENQLITITKDLEELRESEGTTRSAIENDEAQKRIDEIENQTKLLGERKSRKLEKWKEYSKLCDSLSYTKEIVETTFYKYLEEAKKEKDTNDKTLSDLIAERDELNIQLRDLKQKENEEKLELESLKKRKTQIPEGNLRIRQEILDNLEIHESELHFVGELLRVRESESVWEGAIERLLHNFGLSILVPDVHYKRVNHFINQTNLRGRIVYYRIHESGSRIKNIDVKENSLFHKLEIKNDTIFYDWLEREIVERFDYVCCESLEEFQREVTAITKQGLIKSGKSRHEKDDRRNLTDKRNYILGWTNIEKIKAIEKELAKISKEIGKKNEAKETIQRTQLKLQEKDKFLYDFIKFQDYSEIHWQKEAVEIQNLLEEREVLLNSSEKLKLLKQKLQEIQAQISKKDAENTEKQRSIGGFIAKIESCHRELVSCENVLHSTSKEELEKYSPKINQYLANTILNLANIETTKEETNKKIESSKRYKASIEKSRSDAILTQMLRYKTDYPVETVEVDASIDSISEYRQFFKRIQGEDLPKHEKRFKDSLNKETIHDIAMFKNQLEGFAKDIEDKIKQINQSLKDIEYNSGTYIELITDKAQDKNIVEFKESLRNCLEQYVGETEIYNEEKFNRVKVILDRFNSGEITDINWTNKVTDVKNWFAFSVSEKWREDNTEKEFYSDSSGKSGGQKEKLAYTILASALAYQFGLEWKQTKSRSFRFVVIDEAFGRGSDDSTRYGLNLFKRLNLQLLIVTPLQKLNIIEEFVNSVHFISNENGEYSMVRNLTIAEYIQEKEKYNLQ